MAERSRRAHLLISPVVRAALQRAVAMQPQLLEGAGAPAKRGPVADGTRMAPAEVWCQARLQALMRPAAEDSDAPQLCAALLSNQAFFGVQWDSMFLPVRARPAPSRRGAPGSCLGPPSI